MSYYLVAAALGSGWFVVLLVPEMTGNWLRESPGWSIAPLILGSVLTAHFFRKWILGAERFRDQILRAVILPYLGCLIYITLLNLSFAGYALISSSRLNVHNGLVLYYWGPLSAIFGFYVIVPYGLVCQLVLNRMFRHNKNTCTA